MVMMVVLFAAWLLLSLPLAVLVGRGIALGLRSEGDSAVPYPLAAPASVRQPDSAVMELSA